MNANRPFVILSFGKHSVSIYIRNVPTRLYTCLSFARKYFRCYLMSSFSVVGKDLEKAQSEKDSLSKKPRWEKN